MGSGTKIFLSAAAVVTVSFVLQPYRPVIIRGESMSPTFNNGQLVFAMSLNRPPQDGDIVLFEKDGAMLVKRVEMAPGDRYHEAYLKWAHRWIRIGGPGDVLVAKKKAIPSRVSCVPQDKVFVTGDNPSVSLDSRDFGLVPVGSIRGFIPLTG